MSTLGNKLWAISDELRGKMDANEFKNYILGFIFYRYLSEKQELYLNDVLKRDELTFHEAYNTIEFKESIIENSLNVLGYFLEPNYLFNNIILKIKNGEFIIEDLLKALNNIGNSSLGKENEDLINIFEDLDLNSARLGKSPGEKNSLISKLLIKINDIDFKMENGDSKEIGEAFEYLISKFASDAGKKAGEFYTPKEISELIAKIIKVNNPNVRSIYDPTCGSGSLLLRVGKETNAGRFYGQELNINTYNMAKMNLLINEIPFNNLNIKQGDCLSEPQHMDLRFDAIVANPPFSARWDADNVFLIDERFSAYGKLAPRAKADYAFVQHMIYHLDENGAMAVVLPHGVLFRGAAESIIREYIVSTKNYLDAVIGLPANLFYGTSIPTCILVFKKCRPDDSDVLFIDASKDFEKVKNQNKLRSEDIEKIVNTYANREEIEKYSHKATMKEIKDNDFNLNIPRYVDTYEPEELLEMSEIIKNHEEKSKRFMEVTERIEESCKELGIKIPSFKLE